MKKKHPHKNSGGFKQFKRRENLSQGAPSRSASSNGTKNEKFKWKCNFCHKVWHKRVYCFKFKVLPYLSIFSFLVLAFIFPFKQTTQVSKSEKSRLESTPSLTNLSRPILVLSLKKNLLSLCFHHPYTQILHALTTSFCLSSPFFFFYSQFLNLKQSTCLCPILQQKLHFPLNFSFFVALDETNPLEAP